MVFYCPYVLYVGPLVLCTILTINCGFTQGLLDSLGVVERGLRVLHDVAHLLEQDSVLALDFSITSYFATIDTHSLG